MKWAMHPGRRDGDLVNVVTEEDGTEVGLVWNAENATLASAAPELLAALQTIADQCGDFATVQPALDYATIGNIARAAIAKAKGVDIASLISQP